MAKTKMHYRLKPGNDECNRASLAPTPAPLRAPGRALGERLPVVIADDVALPIEPRVRLSGGSACRARAMTAQGLVYSASERPLIVGQLFSA